MHFDIAFQSALDGQLVQLVLGGEIRRRQIVVPAVELNLEVWVLLHGDREIRHDIHRARNLGLRTRRLVQHVPEFVDAEFGLIGLSVAEFEHGAHVIVERRHIGRGNRGRLRIVIRLLAHRIDGGSGEPGIESAGGDFASEQILFEFPAVDAQIGALDVVGRESGVVVQPGCDFRFAFGAQGRARRQRLRVVCQREILDLLQQGFELGGLIRQLMVVPGRRRVRGQCERIRKIHAGIELRRVDAVVEVQYLRQQNDAVQIQSLLVLENIGQRRRARRPVTLAEQILG